MGRRMKRVKRESSSSTSSSLYLNPSYKETHEKYYSEKKVLSERFVDYESFAYPISQCFSGENMIANFLHIRGPAPLTPVRLFYSQIHLLSEEDQFFETFIEGKTHRITPNVIASLLGLKRPSDPVPYPPTSEDELIVSKDEFRRAVYRLDHRNALHKRNMIKVKHLKTIIRILVKICQSNILPRFNHYDETNLDSVYLSFLLLHGYPVDLSYVIWRTMANVGRIRAQAHGVPYGIIVGRLLSYLGHPFPVDTPCADVPTPFDAETLFHPNYFRAGPGSEPRSPCISPSPGGDDYSKVPLSNDPPAESPASFNQAHLSDSIQSIQHTMGIILYCFEQQREEFKRQREMVDHIARQQDHLARQQDRLARQQDRYHAMMMQYIQRAYPNQAAVCQKCGVTGYAELLVYCNICRVSAEHRYCLDKIPKTDVKEVIWSCEKCVSKASLKVSARLLSNQSERVNEEKSKEPQEHLSVGDTSTNTFSNPSIKLS